MTSINKSEDSSKAGYGSVANGETLAKSVTIAVPENEGREDDKGYTDKDMLMRSRAESTIVETRVYNRRWYILFVFCVLQLIQTAAWNNFGPIAEPFKRVFDSTDGVLVLLSNWGAIGTMIFLPPATYLLDVKGLRFSIVISALFLMTGAAARCISFSPFPGTLLANVGEFLNSLAGPILMSAPTVLSATWFPASERTTATGIGTQATSVGTAMSFLLGPYMVPDNPDTGDESQPVTLPAINITDSPYHRKHDAANIRNMMLVEAGYTLLFFILVIVYFPKKPRRPPSHSATTERVDFKKGLKQLLRHKQFWIMAAAYGITGIITGWQAILDLALEPLGVSELDAGWIGFWMCIVSVVAAIVTAYFIDRIGRFRKPLIILETCLGSVCFCWLLLMYEQILPHPLTAVYAAAIGGITFSYMTVPLFCEMAVDVTYPIAEGVTTGALLFPANIINASMVGVSLIPHIPIGWVTWAMVIANTVSGVLMLFVKDKHTRLEEDLLNKELVRERRESMVDHYEPKPRARTRTIDSIMNFLTEGDNESGSDYEE